MNRYRIYGHTINLEDGRTYTPVITIKDPRDFSTFVESVEKGEWVSNDKGITFEGKENVVAAFQPSLIILEGNEDE
jgi:pyruvate kinase